ncbi:dopamine receptor interacting protein 1 [Phyllostomus discolor]|uniref:Dopamine receptor interacting protein 1 n=1 Tax=Phyllostomus discolor TaxID=89673 RepID=A0A834BJ90_9CHIR|nr:dopamine receptor interacting protein 1 [Phyllostomus discolor]
MYPITWIYLITSICWKVPHYLTKKNIIILQLSRLMDIGCTMMASEM